MFQHTAARRRLLDAVEMANIQLHVSTHSRPKAAASINGAVEMCLKVSTHSRPKAAATGLCGWIWFQHGFNTQPPEGGCKIESMPSTYETVSTHSRPKAAASLQILYDTHQHVSTHSRPKAAAYRAEISGCPKWFQHTAARRRLHQSVHSIQEKYHVSTHSRPKAAAQDDMVTMIPFSVSTHSRPKAAAVIIGNAKYQYDVSTHSRPKAAAMRFTLYHFTRLCFNTQPPEGGCVFSHGNILTALVFQHTAARRRLLTGNQSTNSSFIVSTHSRPKAAA